MVTKTILKEWMLEDNGSILQDLLHPGVFTGYVTFTPERAKQALENNTENRTVKEYKQLPQLIQALKDGYWDENISKINFAHDEVLSDGQHRLIAVVKSGVTARCMVTFGVKRTAQLMTDRRGTRTLADDLSIRGYKNVNRLAAIARLLYLKSQGVSYHSIFVRNKAVSAMNDYSLFRFFVEHEGEIMQAEKTASRVYEHVKHLKINRTVVNVLSVEFDAISSDDANYFWKKLSAGVFSEEDDPIYLLYKRFSSNALKGTESIPDFVQAALIIKAWNAFINGEKVKCLKYTAGGASREQFPQISNPYLEEE